MRTLFRPSLFSGFLCLAALAGCANGERLPASGDAASASSEAGAWDGGDVVGDAGRPGADAAVQPAGDASVSELIPTDRIIPWQPGRQGGIPSYPSGKTACSSGCDFATVGDGATDDSKAIQSCIDAAGESHACVLGEGTFSIAQTLYMSSNKALRGMGPAKTLLRNRTGTGYAVYLGSPKASFSGVADERIAAGCSKGSTALTLAAAPTFGAGDTIAVTASNDPALVNVTGDDGECSWCGGPSGKGARTQAMAQIVRVTGVEGKTVTLDRPLYFTFQPSLSPMVLKLPGMVENAGVEDLAIEQVSTVPSLNQGLVTFWLCAGCWAKNVELAKASSEFVEFNFSKGCVLRDSFLHDPQQADSGRGYGAHFLYWNSDHLVENNIIVRARHAVAWEGGGSGCVVGYNYLFQDWESDSDRIWLGNDLIFHGAHPYMNLSEGNIHQQYNPDFIWGSSSHNTYFRNHARAAGDYPETITENVRAVIIRPWSYDQNVVGNVLGTSGSSVPSGPSKECSLDALWSLGCTDEESPPGDPKVLETLFHCANYSAAATLGDSPYAGFAAGALPGIDAECASPLPSSLYLSSKPEWFGSCPWPPIGPDVAGLDTGIPAQRRFEHGSETFGCP